jgi:type I site-specific restriction endonuclease
VRDPRTAHLYRWTRPVRRRPTQAGKRKRTDYILRYHPDYPIAVIEAKTEYRSAKDGVQKAREYAEPLGLRFAYASNGRAIIEIDLAAGTEVERHDFPSPAELWSRQQAGLSLPTESAVTTLLTPGYLDAERPLRYYQEIAVNRALEAVTAGDRRVLLKMCTGAGKWAVAFQTCWRLCKRARQIASSNAARGVRRVMAPTLQTLVACRNTTRSGCRRYVAAKGG